MKPASYRRHGASVAAAGAMVAGRTVGKGQSAAGTRRSTALPAGGPRQPGGTTSDLWKWGIRAEGLHAVGLPVSLALGSFRATMVGLLRPRGRERRIVMRRPLPRSWCEHVPHRPGAPSSPHRVERRMIVRPGPSELERVQMSASATQPSGDASKRPDCKPAPHGAAQAPPTPSRSTPYQHLDAAARERLAAAARRMRMRGPGGNGDSSRS